MNFIYDIVLNFNKNYYKSKEKIIGKYDVATRKI